VKDPRSGIEQTQKYTQRNVRLKKLPHYKQPMRGLEEGGSKGTREKEMRWKAVRSYDA